jgi:hypothetical protein
VSELRPDNLNSLLSAAGGGGLSRRTPAARVAVQPWQDTFATALQQKGMDSLFVSRRWLSALSETYGFTVWASTLAVSDEVAAAIPYCEIEDLCGRRLVSLPFSDYVDPLVDSASVWDAVIAPLISSDAPIRLRLLRNQVPWGDRRFERRMHAAWHGTDLTRTEGEIWSALASSARKDIGRAETWLKVRKGRTMEDLRVFYDMHCHVRKSKYRLFAQPFRFFENLHHVFAPDNLVLLLAERDGAAVAGTLFLLHGDTLYYKFNASIDVADRPNHLLIWHGICLGRALGLTRLDFGISNIDQPGLVRFKRKFASHELPIAELRRQPDARRDLRGAQGQDVLRRLTEILTAPTVPNEITRSVGDEVYRFFS